MRIQELAKELQTAIKNAVLDGSAKLTVTPSSNYFKGIGYEFDVKVQIDGVEVTLSPNTDGYVCFGGIKVQGDVFTTEELNKLREIAAPKLAKFAEIERLQAQIKELEESL